MAQTRHRPTYSLTLDPAVVEGARAVLAQLPAAPSLSGLVDELLTSWVSEVAPLLERLKDADADPVKRLSVLHEVYGRQMAQIGREFDAAARAASETQKGE